MSVIAVFFHCCHLWKDTKRKMEASTNAVTLIAIATIVSGVNKSAKPVFSEKRPDEGVNQNYWWGFCIYSSLKQCAMKSNDETFMFKGKDDYARTKANFTSFFSKRSEFVRLRAPGFLYKMRYIALVVRCWKSLTSPNMVAKILKLGWNSEN